MIATRYCDVEYEPTLLSRLNDALRLPGLRTIDERLDYLVEKAEIIMGMFPAGLRLKLVVLPDRRAVADKYAELYGRREDDIAFYALSSDTIYISLDDAAVHVLAHEIGHFLVDQFFTERPPSHIHELLAQYCEKHITDHVHGE